jgi:nucleoid-associated protein YgaU
MTQVRRPRSFSPHLRLLALCLVVLLVEGGTVALLGTALRHAWATVQAPGPTRPADALLLCVAATGTLLVAWLALSLALSLLAALPGAAGAVAARGAATLAPATVRRLAAALLGASLGATLSAGTAMATMAAAPATASAAVTAPAGPVTGDPGGGVRSAAWPLPPGGSGAHASTAAGRSAGTTDGTGVTDGTTVGTADSTGATAPDAAWTPSRPDRTPVPDPDALHLLSPAPEAGTLVDEGVVVRRGDTLWSIAARSLGPAATADEIAREWPRWHEANRDAIGDDPDLIQPGQVLHPPAPTTGTP